MTRHFTVSHLCLCLAMLASTPAVGAPAGETKNAFLQVGIDALASGLRTVTVGVDIGKESTLVQRMNEVHFGMSLSGWTFLAQEVLIREGTSTTVLLTYGRRPS